MAELQTPESLKEHQPKYNEGAWAEYTLQELGNWVHLFTKRSYHRKDYDKRVKDLNDAQSYLDMMQAQLDLAKSEAQAAKQ